MNKELKKLRIALKGKYSELAKELGISTSTVSRVLNGQIDNTAILKAAVEKAKAVKAEKMAIFQ
jgi:transcriptional regulator with XRE-family HTH domain